MNDTGIPKSCPASEPPVKVCAFCLWQAGKRGAVDSKSSYICPSHKEAARRVAHDMQRVLGMQ